MFSFNPHQPTGRSEGFIALMSILILSAVLLASTISVAQFGIANRFFILNLEQKNSSKKLAEACVHIARIKVYSDPTYTVSTPHVISVADGSCSIYKVTQSGINTMIKTTAENGQATSNLCVTVDNTTGDFLFFKELPSVTDTCP